jgi:hypothetical protein
MLSGSGNRKHIPERRCTLVLGGLDQGKNIEHSGYNEYFVHPSVLLNLIIKICQTYKSYRI